MNATIVISMIAAGTLLGGAAVAAQPSPTFSNWADAARHYMSASKPSNGTHTPTVDRNEGGNHAVAACQEEDHDDVRAAAHDHANETHGHGGETREQHGEHVRWAAHDECRDAHDYEDDADGGHDEGRHGRSEDSD